MKKIWKLWKKGKLNIEMIGKIRKKCKLNHENIWKTWKKSRLNCEIILKIRKKRKSNRKKIGKIQKILS